jgi:endoglucanase
MAMTYRLFAPARRIVRVPSLFFARRFAACGFAACAFAACASSPPASAPSAAPAAAPTVPAPAAPVDAPPEGGKYIPWTTSFTSPGAGSGAVKDGQFCILVTNKGKDPWDAQMRHREMIIQKGHTYSIRYMAHSTKPIQVKAKVGMSGPPYKEYWTDTVDLTTHPQTFVGVFKMEDDDDATAEFAFHFGGPNAGDTQPPYTVCFDDMHLDDPKFVKPKAEAAEAPIHALTVNQVGYLPALPKLATLKSASKTPLKWELSKKGGAVAASGETKPIGKDAASGEDVHVIDFSSVTAPGKDYTLKVGSDVSNPFDIAADVYKKLKYDALAVFYQQRSGVAIAMPYAGGKQWTRPAGHVNVKANDPVKDSPNTGDKAVPCLKDSGCDYTLDVTSGWYDAGDHGKYVVNGGIATWELLSTYERELLARTGESGRLRDGTLAVPESGNKVPDVIDEARWELEFLLKMQVPDGRPLAGMAHHKVHDDQWTGLPLLPSDDPQKRELHPPSTQATLNLAATAAQAARLYRPYDRAFAAKALTAARKAWTAALAHPAMYASASDGTGGGTYDDTNATDEFYWAAVELYLTTGEKQFADYVRTSPLNTADIFGPTGFDWGRTAAAGRLDLATVPSKFPGRDKARQSVVKGADRYLATLTSQPYGMPYAPDGNVYDWGSSAQVLNNAVVLATAYDITGAAKYRDGATQSMDYILGRNALNISYVTGYGETNSHNQHSRWYAHELDPTLPNPPKGTLAGGPNSSIQDPTHRANSRAASASSATSTTSSPGRPTRPPSTGTRPWPAWRPSSPTRADHPYGLL